MDKQSDALNGDTKTFGFHLSYPEHPVYPALREDTKAILYASTVLKVRPDNRYFVCGDMYSGNLEFCRITGDHIDTAVAIAKELGVPETVIALTFVALGTSLPELVTAITSLVKGHGSLSVGNIIGANLFNLVLVSGVSVTLAPFEVPVGKTIFGINSSLILDMPLMLVVMALLTIPALTTKKLHRWQGILLLCIYAAFCAIQFGL